MPDLFSPDKHEVAPQASIGLVHFQLDWSKVFS